MRDPTRISSRLKQWLALGLLSVAAWGVGSSVPARAAPSAQVGVRTHIINPPNAITDMTAAPVGSLTGDIQLSWTAPSNLNGVAIDHYSIRFATYPAPSVGQAEAWWNGVAASEFTLSPAHAPGVTEFTTVHGLTTGATYYFAVKSLDKDNSISPIDTRAGTGLQAASRPVNLGVNDPPDTPVNFVGTALSISSIRWTWDPDPTADFYSLFNTTSGLVAQVSTTNVTESNFAPNTAVTRWLMAGNSYGLSGPTSFVTVYTLADTPTNLTISTVSFDRVSLSWLAAANPAGTQYRLERSGDGSNYAPVVTQTGLSYLDTDLSELTTYYYRVRAINGDGQITVPSVVVSTITLEKTDLMAPAEPFALKGTLDPTGNVFTLSWETVDQNVDGTALTDLAGYNIYRRTTLMGAATKLTPTPLSVRTFADQVNKGLFYYTVRAVDINGNESVDSITADSSAEANVIYVADDGLTNLVMPSTVNDLLRSQYNKYGVPLTIALREEPVAANTGVVRTIRLRLLRADTKQELNDLAFAKPQSVVAIGYGLEDGRVATGNPNPNAQGAQAVKGSAVTNATPEQLTMFWNNGVTWVKVGGTLDKAAQTVKIKSSYLGSYQLRVGAMATSLNLDQANVYPRVFTPNGDQRNDFVRFVLENPNNAEVTAEVFDMSGRSVAKLTQSIGIGNATFVWDGKDSNGAVVPGGVYVYRIKGEGKTFTGTVAVAR